MARRKVIALGLVLLFVGTVFSSAVVAADSIGASSEHSGGLLPSFAPGDEVRPQYWWLIGFIAFDWLAHWILEHYISHEVATVYDAISTIVAPEKIGEKLGIKGAKLGVKIISRNKVLIGVFKDSSFVKVITYASRETTEWVKKKLGRDYITKIVEKYVVKEGG